MTTKKAGARAAPAANRSGAESERTKRVGGAGAPLTIDGKLHAPLFADVSAATTVKSLLDCSANGVLLFRLIDVDLGWRDGTPFDPTELDTSVERILQNVDGAHFLISVIVDPPDWWIERRPQDLAEFAVDAPDRPPCVSWASSRWLRDAGDALAAFVRHCAAARWSERCLGIQIRSGQNGDWTHPHAEGLPDIGPKMRDRFRQFALDKYRRNEGLLREAWDFPRADFHGVACPNAGERQVSDLGIYRNPNRRRKVLDYFECLSEVQNEAALSFCRIVKTRSSGRMRAGLAYGLDIAKAGPAEAGCRLPESIWGAQEVDFLVCDADGGPFPLAAFEARDKLVLLREGTGTAYAASGASGLTFPAERAAKVLAGIDPKALTAPTRRVTRRPAEIALFFDPAAPTYLSSSPDSAAIVRYHQKQAELTTRIGAPIDVYPLSDLFDAAIPQYKLYLFPNVIYLSEAERRRLDARVKRSGQTGAWFWAPGLIGEAGVGAELGERLCGMKLRIEREAMSLKARIVSTDDTLVQDVHIGSPFGEDISAAPTVIVSDRKATRLGANRANKTCFAVHRHTDWTGVLYGSGPVPAAMLQNLARSAGCSILTKPGVRVASGPLGLAVSGAPGERLPLENEIPGSTSEVTVPSGGVALLQRAR